MRNSGRLSHYGVIKNLRRYPCWLFSLAGFPKCYNIDKESTPLSACTLKAENLSCIRSLFKTTECEPNCCRYLFCFLQASSFLPAAYLKERPAVILQARSKERLNSKAFSNKCGIIIAGIVRLSLSKPVSMCFLLYYQVIWNL